ncbi:MAG: (2Fe-2S)-binding protein [Planctomycetota bacterium]|jgi:carbon-monoxide dehydrogenase small subunit
MSQMNPLNGPKRPPQDPPAKVLCRLRVNGHDREVAVRPHDVLLDTLREDLRLTGTTRGCDMGTCGCCTVHLDGVPTLSCLTLTLFAEGKEIRTIEDVAPLGTELHPVQRAFHEKGGSQCGYCTPGFIMSTMGLLEENPNPTDAEIRRAISGNMCRCTGYLKILDSVKTAAAELRGETVRQPVETLPSPIGPYDKPLGGDGAGR